MLCAPIELSHDEIYFTASTSASVSASASAERIISSRQQVSLFLSLSLAILYTSITINQGGCCSVLQCAVLCCALGGLCMRARKETRVNNEPYNKNPISLSRISFGPPLPKSLCTNNSFQLATRATRATRRVENITLVLCTVRSLLLRVVPWWWWRWLTRI